jgi:hypothetical protein
MNVNIEISSLVNHGKLRLINAQGRIVLEQPFSGNLGTMKLSNQISSGIYVIEIQTESWAKSSYLSIVE